MEIIIFGFLFVFITLVNAKRYDFRVVSILGQGSSLGIKYGNNVQPLTPSPFPLFIGSVETDTLNEYKYVALDQSNNVIEEENLTRTYSDNKINEVYNRTTKEKINIPKFPQPFKSMFTMGTSNYGPLPNNIIYNVYANCDKEGYADLTSHPFLEGTSERNDKAINCDITIISPEDTFQSPGSIHIIGFGSRLYKKLSWSLKFNKKFLGRKAVKMRALANDSSLIREKLTTEIYKAAGVPVQEGTYARFFINGDCYGLYLMNDGLNGRWLGGYVHGNEKADVGVAYQMDSSHPNGPYADLRYIDDNYTSYSDKGKYRLGEYEEKLLAKEGISGVWQPIIDFTKHYHEWVNKYSVDTSDNAIDALIQFFNVESMLRLLAVETLIFAIDNFWLVMSNADLYYNPERKNYQILPFDFDEVLKGSKGSIFINPDGYVDDCLHWVNYNENAFEHYFTNNLMSHPQIKNRYDIILAKISNEIFTLDQISGYVDAISRLIREDVEWNFNAVDNLSIPYEGIVKHFTLEDFEENIRAGNRTTPIEVNSSSYNLMDWIELRGDRCRAYTSTVDTSNNINISDNVEVEVFSGSLSLLTNNRIILWLLWFIFAQFIFNFVI